MSKTLKINSQELADLQLIIQTYEKKIAKQSGGDKVAILAYRPMENTEVVFTDVYQTIDPANAIGKSFGRANTELNNINDLVNKNTSGLVEKAFADLYKTGKTADRKVEGSVGPVTISSENTIAGMAKAFEEGDVGKGFSVLLNDCIPCDLRLEAIKLTPDISFLEQIINFAVDFISQVKDLALDLTSPPPDEVDLCAHLNLLNFSCIPDLKALTMMMAKGIQIDLELPAFKLPGLGDLISMVVIPILGIFANLAQLWMNIVVNPIDCLIRQLDSLLNKLSIQAGTTGASVNVNTTDTSKNISFKATAAFSPKQVDQYNKNFITPARNNLKKIIDFIKELRNKVVNKFQSIIQKFTASQNQAMRSIFGLISGIQKVLKAISVLKIITLLINIFNTKINNCNSKTEAIKKTEEEASRRVSESIPGSSSVKTENGGVSLSKKISITKEEAKALGFTKESFKERGATLEDVSEDDSSAILSISKQVLKDGCQLYSHREHFASVDRMIESF